MPQKGKVAVDLVGVARKRRGWLLDQETRLWEEARSTEPARRIEINHKRIAAGVNAKALLGFFIH